MTRSLIALVACLPLAADWPQFRGPDGTGVTTASAPPAEWTTADIAWTAKLPGAGWAQPVVHGDTVFVLSAVSDPPIAPKGFLGGVMMPQSRGGQAPAAPDVTIDWKLFALELATGKEKWAASITKAKPKYAIHPSNTYATETPAFAENKVICYLGATGTLKAFDLTGKPAWTLELGAGETSNGFGTGASPIVHAGKVYVQQHNEAVARLVCVDVGTGQQIWEAKREKPGTSWASPFVWKQAERTDIVSCGRGLVTGHDPGTGEEIWRVGGLDSSFSSTPAATPERLYFGTSGPGSSAPLVALKAGATGDCTLAKKEKSNEWVVWSKTGAGPGMPSPIAVADKLFILGRAGLVCYDGATGEQLYNERLPKLGTIAASPFVAGDRFTVVDESGKVVSVKLGPPFEVVGQAKVADTVWASPTPIEGGLLIRGVEALYCIRKK